MTKSPLLTKLDELIQAQGGNYKAISLRAKLGETAVRDIIVGRVRNPGIYTLDKIVCALGTSLFGLMEGENGMSRTSNLVPLLGYVGAGGKVHSFDDLPLIPRALTETEREDVNCEFVDAPPGTYPDGLVALRVTGISQMPFMPPGTTVYYSHRLLGGASTECIGKICVVETSSGATMLKIVRKSPFHGRFDLLSYNMDVIEGMELAWCAQVIFIKPG